MDEESIRIEVRRMRDRREWTLLGLLVASSLILTAVLPLADDEVYYWCWAKPLHRRGQRRSRLRPRHVGRRCPRVRDRAAITIASAAAVDRVYSALHVGIGPHHSRRAVDDVLDRLRLVVG